jgi:hypothetical protein
VGEESPARLIEELKKFKERVQKAAGVDEIIVFGSAASGSVRENGDVDLIIVSKKYEGKHFVDRAVELYNHWHLPYPVDFICLSPSEFERMKRRVSLVSEALKHGIRL